jgi:GT2 family glycosyltransferase
MDSPDQPQCAVDEVGAMRPVEQTLVSVVIPNWNRERAIALCIDSVRMQTYPHIEVLVVDDHSTDNSPRIAAKLGVTVLTTEVNSGPPLARNIGAARARGDIIFFLDSDVALEPDAIATAVRILEADARIGAVTGLLRAEPLLGLRRIEEYRAMQLHCWSYRADGPTPGNQIHTALFAVRREVWDEVGPIDPQRRYDEGSEYGRRLSAHGYTVCAVRAVAGRKDSDSTLGVVVSKVYMRSRAHALKRDPDVPLAGGGGRIVASMLTAVAVPLLALPAFVGPAGLLVPVAAVASAIVLDAGTYRYAFTHRGPWFGLYFTGMQQVFNLSSAVGGGIGTLQRMSARFRPSRSRELNYDRDNGTTVTS